MANIKNTHKQIIRTLKMPIMDSTRELTIILIYSFLVIIRRGLKVRSNLIILRLTPESSISKIEVQTMKKSSLFQLDLR